MKEYIKKYAPLGLFFLFIPYFFYVLPINLHADISRTLIRVLALAGSQFSFGIDAYSLYVNPIFLIIKNVHGALPLTLFFPVFYVVDLFGARITENSVSAVYVGVGFALTLLNYWFLSKSIGKRRAFLFALLLSVIPYYVMIIKVGWWMIHYYPLFFAGLWFLREFLLSSERKWYAYFCVSSALLTISTPDFFFSGIFYILYILVHGYVHKGGVMGSLYFFYKTVVSFWTIIPVATILLLSAFSYIGRAMFGGEYGIMAHIVVKGGIPKYYHPAVLVHLGVHGLGLLGYIFFPAMFLALARIIYQWKNFKTNTLLVATVIYFFILWAMLLLAGGITGAALAIFFFPGILFILYALDSLRFGWKIKAVIFSLIVIGSYAQTILYLVGYAPKNTFLTTTGWVPYPRACEALWCPYHFGTYQNLGIKTLGYVARDYLGVSPKEFVSREKSQEYREDFLFHSMFGDGPVSHIGRRISDTLKESNGSPSVIAQFTEEFVASRQKIVIVDEYRKIDRYLRDNVQYKKVAVITQKGVPIMDVYELNGQKETKIFAVEYYDNLFDERYATLKSIGKVDLGS